MPRHAQEVHRGPTVLETAAKLLLEPHGEKDGRQLLSIPEVLQLPQNAQRVQLILESAARLFRTTWRRRVANRLLGRFQKYFRCFKMRKRSKSSCSARPLTLWELRADHDGQLTLGQVPEVLQMLQHTQGVQIVLGSMARLWVYQKCFR